MWVSIWHIGHDVALAIYSGDDKSLEAVLEQARQCHSNLPQISVVYRMKFSELPEGRNPFGFKNGLHNPHVEGSGIPLQPGSGETIKAGEFILGPDEAVEKIIRHSKALGGISRITFMMNPASLPHEKLMQATKLIGTHIAPALREVEEQQVKVL